MDEDDNVIPDYTGTIFVISFTDNEIELPNTLEEWEYTFTLSDEWSVKFENAIVFKTPGTQELNVYDADSESDDIFGVTEVLVTEDWWTDTGTDTKAISITSPESGTTLTSSSISVAGQTEANHRVIITAWGSDYEAVSNSDWVYETELSELVDGDLEITAKVLDADENTVGTSEKVNVKVSAGVPTMKELTIFPEEGAPSFNYSITVLSDPGLATVEAIVNDTVNILTETEAGRYAAELVAPDEPGGYGVSITLINNLGVRSENPFVGNISVVQSAAEEVEEIEPEPVEEPEEVEPEPVQEVEEIPWGPSGSTQTVESIDLNITWLKLTKLKTQSLLTWDPVENADYYNVYIKEWMNYNLVEKVIEPKYLVNITGNDIAYEDFAVSAVMEASSKAWMQQWDYSDAIRVQTGPALYILSIILALMWAFGLAYMSRKTA